MSGFNERVNATVGGWGAPRDGTPRDKGIIDSYNTGTGLKPVAPLPVKGNPGVRQDALIQPAAGKIRNLGDHQFAAAGEALQIRFENKRNERITNEENLPFWDCSSTMEKARGIGLTVTVDGSGAVLVLQVHCSGPRDYVVPVSYTHLTLPTKRIV